MVIEQAKGVLAQHFGLSMDGAFDRLRTFSRSHNLRLAEVAHEIVDGQLEPAGLTTADSISMQHTELTNAVPPHWVAGVEWRVRDGDGVWTRPVWLLSGSGSGSGSGGAGRWSCPGGALQQVGPGPAVGVGVGVGQTVTAHPLTVPWTPRVARRARLIAAARNRKSASTRSVPRTRARRPPCRRRIRCPSFRSTFGRVAR